MARYAAIALFTIAVLRAQGQAPLLDIRISTETVPAGGTAQIKVYLGTPQPISGGSIVLTFSGAGYPASKPPIQAATVFSATGDVAAVGIVNPYGGSFSLMFNSPSAGVGRLPGVPILEFSIPLENGFSVALDPSSSFGGPQGMYGFTAQPGGAAIGGVLSIQSVTPSGSTGILAAGSILTIKGTGFQSGTSVRLEGVKAAAVDIASPSVINVTLGGATEITGKQIVVRNPDGSQLTYWGGLGDSLYTFPLNPTSSAICGRKGPSFQDPLELAVQNPNPVAAQVTISNVVSSGNSAPGQSQTVTVPSGGIYRTAISDPPYSTVQSDPSTPIRVLGVLYDHFFVPLGLLPVLPQTGSRPSIGAIVNAASQFQSSVSPGEIVTVFGVNLGPATSAQMSLDDRGYVREDINGVRVLFNGIAAPLLYVSASQVNAVVPYEINPGDVTTMQVEYDAAASAVWGVPAVAAVPAIFTLSASGQGGAAVLNQDNSINSPTNPALRGSILQIYGTGEGLTSPAATTGAIVDKASRPLLPVRVTIGGKDALVTYSGSSPGSVAGLFQVNAQLPDDLAPGSAVPVVLTVGSEVSHAAVTVAVK